MLVFNEARTRNSRPPASRARGTIATLVAAFAFVVGLQLIGADRADAACYEVGGSTTIAYQCDIYGSAHYTGGGGGGGGGAGGQAEVGIGEEANTGGGGPDLIRRDLPLSVISKVDQSLANGNCKSLVSPVNPPYQNAIQVWDSVNVYQSDTQPSDRPYSLATATGAGTTGYITLWPLFNSTGPTEIFSLIPAHHGVTRLPDEAEMKALTVLHEIAHLTGALNHDPAGSRLFNLLILERCFGIGNIPV